jgi:hypothetical protein
MHELTIRTRATPRLKIVGVARRAPRSLRPNGSERQHTGCVAPHRVRECEAPQDPHEQSAALVSAGRALPDRPTEKCPLGKKCLARAAWLDAFCELQ